MQDTKLSEAALGLESPWEVVEIQLKATEETVLVEVAANSRRLPCPIRVKSCPEYDASPASGRPSSSFGAYSPSPFKNSESIERPEAIP